MNNWSKRHHWSTVLVLTLVSFGAVPTGFTESDSSKAKLEEKARSLFARDDRIGLAVVLHFGGRTRFFLEGWADYDRKIPVTLDSLFNLASVSKVFDAALLSLAAHEGELTLDEPISKYVPEVQSKHAGGITLRQLASHTSGFTLPQDHPPWPEKNYTWAGFLEVLQAWTPQQEPGTALVYSHAGFMLLHVVLERALGAPFSDLLERRILDPLGLASTTLPRPGRTFRGELPGSLKEKAVQGYSIDGSAAGDPGEQQSFYHWPSAGQMYSSARDMAVFLEANLGETPKPALTRALHRAQEPVFRVDILTAIGLAWERYEEGGLTFIEKYGGLYNSSSYVGLIAGQHLGIVVLCNRGEQDVIRFGREIIKEISEMSHLGER